MSLVGILTLLWISNALFALYAQNPPASLLSAQPCRILQYKQPQQRKHTWDKGIKHQYWPHLQTPLLASPANIVTYCASEKTNAFKNGGKTRKVDLRIDAFLTPWNPNCNHSIKVFYCHSVLSVFHNVANFLTIQNFNRLAKMRWEKEVLHIIFKSFIEGHSYQNLAIQGSSLVLLFNSSFLTEILVVLQFRHVQQL